MNRKAEELGIMCSTDLGRYLADGKYPEPDFVELVLFYDLVKNHDADPVALKAGFLHGVEGKPKRLIDDYEVDKVIWDLGYMLGKLTKPKSME